MDRVGVQFDGNGTGAIVAARETAGAIDKVKRSAAGSSVPLRGMEKDLGRVERGALAGSGAFKGLGRSVAFASGAFLGAAGLTEAIKHSIDVTLAAQTSISHLDQAIKNAHASVKALTPIMEEHAAAARRLGFDDNDTRDAEAKLVTAFGATKHALDELTAAQDLARQSNIPLGDATRQLILLQEGNARAAKQFGLSLPDLTAKQWAAKAAADGLNVAQEKGKTLYDELLPRIKDQAAAFANTPAGKIAEFHAQVTHLEESIGTGLLPVVDKYLTEVDDWLAKGPNQKRVTDDVRKAVDTLTGVLGDMKKEIDRVKPVADDVVKALGGWKQVIEDLIALKFASVILGWAASFKRLAGAEGIAGAETAATGLLGKLTALQKLGAIGIVVSLIPKAPNTPTNYGNHSGFAGFLGNLPLVGGAFSQLNRLAGAIDQALGLYGGSAGGGPPGSLTIPPGTVIPGKGIQLPTFINPTHQTAGLAGFPAVDIMAKPGTPIRAPENGVITRISGHEPTEAPPDGQGGPWGLSIYFLGTQSGNTYYMTHLVKVAGLGGYKKGDVIGVIGDYPGSPADHVHFAIHTGDSSEAHAPSGMFNPSDFLGGTKPRSSGSPYGPSTQPPPTTPPPTKTKWVGATAATIISAQGGISAMLRGLPADLDPVEKNAVAHIDKIRDALHIHMTPAELAKDRVELTRWGKVLHDEISKQAKVVAAAAAEAKKKFDQALSLDISHVLRDFDQAFSVQMLAFDRETQRGLAKFVVAQTPEEKALADFIAQRGAEQHAATVAQQQSDLAAAIASGDPAQIKAAQDAINNQLEDDQQAALQAAADASRVAQDAKTTADQQAYQDQRDQQKQALQNINDDQRIALQNNLDDWTAWIQSKKKTWTEFLTWLQNNGFDTSTLINPGASGSGSGSGGADVTRLVSPGAAIPFATGGRVPGQYVGRQDTILARLTPGETVINRKLTAALEDMLVQGGAGGHTVAVFDLDGHRFAQATARPMTDEQARQIGYTIQRG